MKRSGVLTRETVNGIRRVMRKFSYYGSNVDIWHLVDTVDAHRLVIERLQSGWEATQLPHGWEAAGAGHDYIGYWVTGAKINLYEEMSQAEQLVVYDRIVRPEAPPWSPEEA